MRSTDLRALIFDVDGTLADTESAHCAAFNHAFAQSGLDWHWDAALYIRLLEVAGGRERITHYWNQLRGDTARVDSDARADTVRRIHQRKTAAYQRMAQDGALRLRPGVQRLLEAGFSAGLRLAIASTTSPANITVLLSAALGPGWSDMFEVIEDGCTAPRKKPDPQVYAQTLERLGLPASACLAFEDSAQGLTAATRAGLATLVTPNAFTAHHDFTGALRLLPDLQGVTLAALHAWHAAAHGFALPNP